MTIAEAKADRLQRVVDIVEGILTEIAGEDDSPYVVAPAMTEFLMDLQTRLMRISHERLAAFMRQKNQPGD